MKLGIFGGTFNPVHTGHIRTAIEVLERLELDRVELVPAMDPPHKDGHDLLPFDLRLSMAEAAVADIDGLGANPIEGARPGPSFTCDTLECYRTEQPERELTFIMGASTFLELPNWKRGLDLPDMASLAVVTRWQALEKVAGFVAKHWPTADLLGAGQWRLASGNKLTCVEIPRLDIKAGEIRGRWVQGKRLSMLVPPAVEQLLEENRERVQKIWGER